MTTTTTNAEESMPGRVDGWGILEVMGHRRLAGQVTEVEVCGARMLRVDVPDTSEEAAPDAVHLTQFYPPSAIFCLTPTTEAKAREEASRLQPRPPRRWAGLPRPEPEPEPEPEPDDEEDAYIDDEDEQVDYDEQEARLRRLDEREFA
jgi:hypothetical protein